ncbi:MAG: hypothetical protein ACE368_08600 [Paracoccaceae bacterium]
MATAAGGTFHLRIDDLDQSPASTAWETRQIEATISPGWVITGPSRLAASRPPSPPTGRLPTFWIAAPLPCTLHPGRYPRRRLCPKAPDARCWTG